MRSISRLSRGASFLFRGWRTLSMHRRLRIWVLMPLAIDGFMLAAGWAYGLSRASQWTNWVLAFIIKPESGLWFSLLFYVLLPLFFIVFMVLWLYVVFVAATVIAAPFNSILAEKALVQLGLREKSSLGLLGSVKSALKMSLIGLVKGLVLSILGLVFFVGSFVPGLNLLSVFGILWIMAFDCADYCLEATGLGLRQRFHYARAHFAEFSGMAGALSLTLVIPGFTVLLLPIGVTGFASLLAEEQLKGR